MNPYSFVNPYVRACKKYLYDLHQGSYNESSEEFIDRIAPFIATSKDAERLTKLMGSLFSAGYVKATQDIQERLAKENIQLKIVNPVQKNPVQSLKQNNS